MKRRVGPGRLLGELGDLFSPDRIRRNLDRTVDRILVKLKWLPEFVDGRNMLLHLTDTPTGIYPYIARILRRINPSVVVHTGDMADNIKLELYEGEANHYRQAMKQFANIITAPHRRVFLFIGNHDRRELLPYLPPQCIVCDDVMTISFKGITFRASHYYERVAALPGQYNLFGHACEPPSYEDEDERLFLNGVEAIRLIDPVSGEITALPYPKSTESARTMRHGGRRH